MSISGIKLVILQFELPSTEPTLLAHIIKLIISFHDPVVGFLQSAKQKLRSESTVYGNQFGFLSNRPTIEAHLIKRLIEQLRSKQKDFAYDIHVYIEKHMIEYQEMYFGGR